MAEYYDLLTDHTQRTPLTPAPEITEVEHVTVRHDPGWYCAHPRWGVYKDFGGGEVIVGFKMARSAYKQISDINHGGVVRPGYEARAVIVVQRSLDGGRTWPRENDVILYDEAISDDEKRAFLYQEGAPREQYDMFSPDSVFWFTHTNLWDEQRMVCFGLRSADRGRTWEKVPTVIDPPPGRVSGAQEVLAGRAPRRRQDAHYRLQRRNQPHLPQPRSGHHLGVRQPFGCGPNRRRLVHL